MAPHDYVIYCQARGLSRHTSPCGECALSHFGDYARGLAACSAGFLLFFCFGPWYHMTVIYCQARGLSGHTSPRGECACFFWRTPCLLKPKKVISFPRGRTLSGHTWSTVKKFSILDLSSLHPYGKPCLGHVARRWSALLGDDVCCSATAHNCSATHYDGRIMSWTARLWFTPARTSSRWRCTMGTRCLGTSYGGV